jgi:pimeloyl-ACP methyl ester carboxylesterase
LTASSAKILRRIKYFFFFLLVAMAAVMHACVDFRMSRREIDRFFQEKKLNGTQEQYKTGDGHEIHYVTSGDDRLPLVLFVHGSPGSLSAFIDFMADSVLLQRALLVTTDRPGFGHSNFGMAEPSLEKQAAILKPILEKYKSNRPVILVGHSLGGPLIARMAMSYPDLVDGLVIVAGSIDPELEPDETWFRAPLATPFLSWILPRSFRSSNEEIYQLKPQLQKMLPHWKEITCPVVVIQGKADSLVPPGNADFARKMLVNAPVDFVLVDGMDHFVPWSHPGLIRDAILRLLDRTQTKDTSP